MSWYNKEQPTPFDSAEIPGLHFLDGDQLAELIHQQWTKKQKMPMIAFPSGEECQIWESARPETGGVIHLFGEMDLPCYSVRDEAYRHAEEIAEQCGYAVKKVGDNQLEVLGQTPDEHYLLTYDGVRLADVQKLRRGWELPLHPAHQLMTDELRQKLPQLYTNEEIGLDVIAPVKYFTPDSHWTWYASEFDGKDLMFGLVSGFEVELGYFSLSELQSVRGPMGLRVERDLDYEPRTLRELKAMHDREHRL